MKLRGTFASIRLRNQLVPDVHGGYTRNIPSGEVMSVFDAATCYRADNTPTIVVAGKEYGTGSSRDWAAKGTRLLGVHAVLAISFERIHRSNLIGMGVLPLTFMEGENADTLNINADSELDISDLETLEPGKRLRVQHLNSAGMSEFEALCRIGTLDQLSYFKDGGILSYVLNQLS